jgi:hypothetical protein
MPTGRTSVLGDASENSNAKNMLLSDRKHVAELKFYPLCLTNCCKTGSLTGKSLGQTLLPLSDAIRNMNGFIVAFARFPQFPNNTQPAIG